MFDIMCYCYRLRIEVLIHNICLLSSVIMAKGQPMKAAAPKAMKAMKKKAAMKAMKAMKKKAAMKAMKAMKKKAAMKAMKAMKK